MSRTQAAVLAVSLAAVLPYARTVDNYFVQDDFGVVWLLSQKPWSYFPRWFASTWMDDIWGYTPDEIRPFPAVTYQLAAVLGAASPYANHAINIAFHAANGWLVLWLCRAAAGLSLAGATLAALVFVLLPFQSETVAWITGRVDSMPACFYLLSFVYYARWRRAAGESRLYWTSVVWFFVALFTKQNAITLGPALVAFDVVVERRSVRACWQWVRPYVPYAALTMGYLALRMALFGEVVRESQLTAANLSFFGGLIMRHLERTVFGEVGAGTVVRWALVCAGFVWVAVAACRRDGREAGRAGRVALYFGLLWWLIGVAPTVVAAYESPRHIYLASVAWGVMLGLAFDLAARNGRRWHVAAASVFAVGLAGYTTRLLGNVADWERRASVSARAVADLEREALRAPDGSLVFAAAPVDSWEWAAPFVIRAPFVRPDVERRITLVTPWRLHCCRSQWDEHTRQRLRAWQTRGRGAVIALRWDARGTLFRLSSLEEPYLASLVDVFLATDSYTTLDGAMLSVLDRLPAARGQTRVGPGSDPGLSTSTQRLKVAESNRSPSANRALRRTDASDASTPAGESGGSAFDRSIRPGSSGV